MVAICALGFEEGMMMPLPNARSSSVGRHLDMCIIERDSVIAS